MSRKPKQYVSTRMYIDLPQILIELGAEGKNDPFIVDRFFNLYRQYSEQFDRSGEPNINPTDMFEEYECANPSHTLRDHSSSLDNEVSGCPNKGRLLSFDHDVSMCKDQGNGFLIEGWNLLQTIAYLPDIFWARPVIVKLFFLVAIHLMDIEHPDKECPLTFFAVIHCLSDQRREILRQSINRLVLLPKQTFWEKLRGHQTFDQRTSVYYLAAFVNEVKDIKRSLMLYILGSSANCKSYSYFWCDTIHDCMRIMDTEIRRRQSKFFRCINDMVGELFIGNRYYDRFNDDAISTSSELWMREKSKSSWDDFQKMNGPFPKKTFFEFCFENNESEFYHLHIPFFRCKNITPTIMPQYQPWEVRRKIARRERLLEIVKRKQFLKSDEHHLASEIAEIHNRFFKADVGVADDQFSSEEWNSIVSGTCDNYYTDQIVKAEPVIDKNNQETTNHIVPSAPSTCQLRPSAFNPAYMPTNMIDAQAVAELEQRVTSINAETKELEKVSQLIEKRLDNVQYEQEALKLVQENYVSKKVVPCLMASFDVGYQKILNFLTAHMQGVMAATNIGEQKLIIQVKHDRVQQNPILEDYYQMVQYRLVMMISTCVALDSGYIKINFRQSTHKALKHTHKTTDIFFDILEHCGEANIPFVKLITNCLYNAIKYIPNTCEKNALNRVAILKLRGGKQLENIVEEFALDLALDERTLKKIGCLEYNNSTTKGFFTRMYNWTKKCYDELIQSNPELETPAAKLATDDVNKLIVKIMCGQQINKTCLQTFLTEKMNEVLIEEGEQAMAGGDSRSEPEVSSNVCVSQTYMFTEREHTTRNSQKLDLLQDKVGELERESKALQAQLAKLKKHSEVESCVTISASNQVQLQVSRNPNALYGYPQAVADARRLAELENQLRQMSSLILNVAESAGILIDDDEPVDSYEKAELLSHNSDLL